MTSKFLTLFLIVIFLVTPLTSAIYIGEAESEPTIITLTITESGPENENPHNPNNSDIIKNEDEEFEKSLREIKYSEWSCINNRLQRTKTSLNHVEYEYGQACGFELSKTKSNEGIFFFILCLFLILFILLIATLIALVLINRDN